MAWSIKEELIDECEFHYTSLLSIYSTYPTKIGYGCFGLSWVATIL
jgi:hypothetical protein